MNYQSLSDIIVRFGEKAHLPQDAMKHFEVATVRMSDGSENVMLAGLLPKNQHGAIPLVMGCCRLYRNIILTDTERVDMLCIRNMPRWEEDFYEFGTHLGIDREQLERMLLDILNCDAAKEEEG